ncbi:MAG TPA: glycosyltransferase family 2 protein [Acidimicrobiales bacterium]|nr:glycosyltransferase family 2 protein [Acidimicrobiales bacterium]
MTNQHHSLDGADELARIVAALERATREFDALLNGERLRPPDHWHGRDRDDPEAEDLASRPEGGYPPDAAEDRRAYHRWLAQRGEPTSLGSPGDEPRRTPVTRTPWRGAPLVTVVVVVSDAPADLVARCAGSIFAQSFARWELVLVRDAASLAPADCLSSLRRVDRRVRVVEAAAGETVDAINRAIGAARGEFVTLVDASDELAPGALQAIAEVTANSPDADIVYTDADQIDPVGERFAPSLKPAWSPDLFLGCNYIGHLAAIRRALVADLGGLRSGFADAAEYDLVLRATERARRIFHVPGVAYHRRQSKAPRTEERGRGEDPTRRVLVDALARRGERAAIETGALEGHFNLRRAVDRQPLVSIIIPFRDEPSLLSKCVRSIRAEPGYDQFELVLVDNESELPETMALLARLAEERGVRLVRAPGSFNWSAINNAAVAQCAGELLVFMNNDIEARRPLWLDALVGHALRPQVGAVGARLLYPDGSLQHGGVVFGLGGLAGHVLRGLPGDRPGYQAMAVQTRNCSAVTGACMMTRRKVFESVGGFDESLSVAFNDVDYCLKLREAGYLVVYTPLTELVHHESRSRGHTEDSAAQRRIRERFGAALEVGDPYYNPLLSKWRDWCPISTVQEDERWTNFLMTTLSTPDPSSSS